MPTIGQRIKKRRLELGYSADYVAERLGKDRATIYRYESDKIENMPINIVTPLAEVLGVTPAYIMGWNEEDGQSAETQPVADTMIVEERDEIELLRLYRGAEPSAREIAVETLANHQVKEKESADAS